MLFIFVLPAMQVILFCLAIGREPREMKFGVVNNEIPWNASCDVVEGCGASNLSCKFLDQLPKDMLSLISYDDVEMAIDDIHKGEIWGYLEFSANFSTAMVERGLAGNLADNFTIYNSRVNVQMDMTSSFFYSLG